MQDYQQLIELSLPEINRRYFEIFPFLGKRTTKNKLFLNVIKYWADFELWKDSTKNLYVLNFTNVNCINPYLIYPYDE